MYQNYVTAYYIVYVSFSCMLRACKKNVTFTCVYLSHWYLMQVVKFMMKHVDFEKPLSIHDVLCQSV